jgi:hypothetical protein
VQQNTRRHTLSADGRYFRPARPSCSSFVYSCASDRKGCTLQREWAAAYSHPKYCSRAGAHLLDVVHKAAPKALDKFRLRCHLRVWNGAGAEDFQDGAGRRRNAPIERTRWPSSCVACDLLSSSARLVPVDETDHQRGAFESQTEKRPLALFFCRACVAARCLQFVCV